MRSSSDVALKIALLLTYSSLQLVRGTADVNSGVSKYSFPDDFIFGVGTSALQTEGGWNEGESASPGGKEGAPPVRPPSVELDTKLDTLPPNKRNEFPKLILPCPTLEARDKEGIQGEVNIGNSRLVIHNQNNNIKYEAKETRGQQSTIYYYEGDGKGESVFDAFIHEHPRYAVDQGNVDIADDSYHRYMDDIRIIKSLGVQAYRMSISWPRILPNGTSNNINQEGIKHYRTLFEELIKANITPVVTMFHWDMPISLMYLGGWTNANIIDYFEDYARILFNSYGDIVKIWITINEPHENCKNTYGYDMFAPSLKRNGIGIYLCTHNSLLGHARVYRMYEKEFKPVQKGKLSLTLDAMWGDPKDPNKPQDVQAAANYIQMQMGLLSHPIFSEEGNYPSFAREIINNLSRQGGFSRSQLPYFTDEEVVALRGSADFFSLNHYTTELVSLTGIEPDMRLPALFRDTGIKTEPDPTWQMSGPGWLYSYPPGMRKILNWLQNSYKILKTIPIYITENGLCDLGEEGTEDYRRVKYYNDYLYQVLLAIHEDGVNVKGYFAWSLMDDFEFADGYKTKFGLFMVDYNSPNRTRIPKLSAYNYANIVRTRRIDFDYIKQSEV